MAAKVTSYPLWKIRWIFKLDELIWKMSSDNCGDIVSYNMSAFFCNIFRIFYSECEGMDDDL